MMEVFLVYLWLKLDVIRGLVIISAIAGFFLCFFGTLVTCNADKDFNKSRFWVLLICIPLFGFGMMLPSPKEAAILVGTSYAVDLAKSPEGTKVMNLIRKKANDFLDEQLKEEVKK